MDFICYSRCSTCAKVRKLLEEKNLAFQTRDIKEENPTREEVEKWHRASGLDIGKFYNTSGKIYRERGLKDKRKEMSLEAQYDLLATDGMLVKRPILLVGDQVYVGPQVRKYIEDLEG